MCVKRNTVPIQGWWPDSNMPIRFLQTMTSSIRTDVSLEDLIDPDLQNKSMSKIKLFAQLAQELNDLANQYEELLDPKSGVFISLVTLLSFICNLS